MVGPEYHENGEVYDRHRHDAPLEADEHDDTDSTTGSHESITSTGLEHGVLEDIDDNDLPTVASEEPVDYTAPFDIARFSDEQPTPAEAIETSERHRTVSRQVFDRHGELIDFRQHGDRMVSSVDLEYAEGNTHLAVWSDGIIGVISRDAEGAWSAREYHRTDDGILRYDRNIEAEAEAGNHPHPGELPTTLLWRQIYEEEMIEAPNRDLERESGVNYHLVGPREANYVFGLVQHAVPLKIPFSELDALSVTRVQSPTPTGGADAEYGADEFDRHIFNFMKRHGQQYDNPRVPVLARRVVTPEGSHLHIHAGKRSNADGEMAPFVNTVANWGVGRQGIQAFYPKGFEPPKVRSARVNTSLDYTVEAGKLRVVRHTVLTDLKGNQLLEVSPTTTYGDLLEARLVRNFLLDPLLRR